MSVPNRVSTEMPSELARAALLLSRATRSADERINLVPSEAKMSPLARRPLSSDLYFRYFFNQQADPDFWQFRGGQETGCLERDLVTASISRLGKADYVNARPLSGLNAMLLVISALGGEFGSPVVCVEPQSGGHFATTSLIERLGRRPIPLGIEAGRMDEEGLSAALRAEKVPLVYLDLQNSLVEADIRQIAATISRESPGTLLHVDASHTLGLVFGGAHGNPLEMGADSFGGSTHKSFPGPQKGVILTRRDDLNEHLMAAQFDLVSSHHFAETIALGFAAAEFEVFGESYAEQVITNARTLARCLLAEDFEVVSHGPKVTDTHQVWMRFGPIEAVTELGDRLNSAGIAVNVQDDPPGGSGPYFRLGVNEVTFEGGGEETIRLIAAAFAQARDGRMQISGKDIRHSYETPFHFLDSELTAAYA